MASASAAPVARERTYIMIKPDGVQRGLVGEIIARFERKGYKMAAMKLVKPSTEHMEMKDRVVEIVGSIGDKIVTIKATVYEMGSGPVGKVKQMSMTAQTAGALYLGKAGITLKAKTVFLQDGYVYITSAVESRVVYL